MALSKEGAVFIGATYYSFFRTDSATLQIDLTKTVGGWLLAQLYICDFGEIDLQPPNFTQEKRVTSGPSTDLDLHANVVAFGAHEVGVGARAVTREVE